MRKTLNTLIIGIIMLLMSASLFSETVAQPPANFNEENAGTEQNPYQIANLANLRWLSETPTVWGCLVISDAFDPGEWLPPKHFTQTADIDATETIEWEYVTSHRGFLPIGRDTKIDDLEYSWGFNGFYDGNNFSISNLYMENPNKRYQHGFFAVTWEATVKNVILNNVTLLARWSSGSLIGVARHGTLVQNCRVEGNLTIGFYNEDQDDLLNLFGTTLGGLIGLANGAIIENCMVTASIVDDHLYGRSDIGGLIGNANGSLNENDPDNPIVLLTIIRNSAFYGTIEAYPPVPYPFPEEFVFYKAALVGRLNEYTIIENCIVGTENQMNFGAGLVGFVDAGATVINCVWDIEATGISEPFENVEPNAEIVNIQGLSTSLMKNAQSYIEAGFNFTTIWDINPEINNGYPFINLRTQGPVNEKDKTIVPAFHIVAYPNPFNPQTTISFTLPSETVATLDIFNIRGQKVRSLMNEFLNSGHHQVIWNGQDDNGRNLSSGVYFYRLNTENFSQTKRVVLMK